MRGLIMTAGWLLVATPVLPAQSAERDVLAVVQQLFDGMRAGDTARMRTALHPEARLVSAGLRDGAPAVSVVSPDRWLAGVAGASNGPLDERLRDPLVRIDGGLATVWAEYSFYLGERLNHCGVDAFHLVRMPQGWRIIDIADTRRREGCPP